MQTSLNKTSIWVSKVQFVSYFVKKKKQQQLILLVKKMHLASE